MPISSPNHMKQVMVAYMIAVATKYDKMKVYCSITYNSMLVSEVLSRYMESKQNTGKGRFMSPTPPRGISLKV